MVHSQLAKHLPAVCRGAQKRCARGENPIRKLQPQRKGRNPTWFQRTLYPIRGPAPSRKMRWCGSSSIQNNAQEHSAFLVLQAVGTLRIGRRMDHVIISIRVDPQVSTSEILDQATLFSYLPAFRTVKKTFV